MRIPIQSEHLPVQRLIYEDLDVGHQRKYDWFVFRFLEKVDLFINSFTKKTKKKLRAKVAFHELFSTCNDCDAVFYKDFTYGSKRCQSLRDISFNK